MQSEASRLAATEHERSEDVADAGELAAFERHAAEIVEHRRLDRERRDVAAGISDGDGKGLAVGLRRKAEALRLQHRGVDHTGRFDAGGAAGDELADTLDVGFEIECVVLAVLIETDPDARDVDAAETDDVARPGSDLGDGDASAAEEQESGGERLDTQHGNLGTVGTRATPLAGTGMANSG